MTVNGTAVTVTGSTLCNNGVIEKRFAGTISNIFSQWAIGTIQPRVVEFAYSYPLDTFEYTTETIPSYGIWAQDTRYIWEVADQASNGDTRPQVISVSQGQGIFGTNRNAMTATATSAGTDDHGMFLFVYNNHNTIFNDYWWMRDLTNAHTPQRINRMRFWIKIPPEQFVSEDHKHNFHVGTYQRLTTDPANEQESNGWHHYHYYNLEYTDSWTQVIVDMRPHHKRGVTDDNLEPGVLTDMEPGYDYFDLMTYFYLATVKYYSGYPAVTMVDGVEFYEEPHAEDEFGIYAISGTVSGSGQLIVKWSVDINDTNDLFDIKYAFTPFHENGGWSHGTFAPGGQNINPPAPASPSSFNGAAYRTSAISYGANTAIYIAIKNQNEPALFRQIRIPTTAAGFPYLPSTTPDLTEPE